MSETADKGMDVLHPLDTDIEEPSLFNNPFNYEPHPLCLLAADEVMRYIASQPELEADARQGKMLGVLVVRTALHPHRLAFLAAYSGLLAGRNDWPFFVPPVFDAQQPDGHFKTVERQISSINAEVRALSAEAAPPPRLSVLRQQRKQLSEELQLWLFRQYRMLNARGESKDLVDIWRDYHTSPKLQQRFPLPPGGSGDCCAPKLLQYAYQHNLHPVTMAEFWYGDSPRGEIRHHAQFYPACRGKCLPILSFMLQGLEVHKEENDGSDKSRELQVVYEDEFLLVISKPSGLLSVPGRIVAPSVQSILTARYGEVFMPHRLDMDTSGLMVVARTEAVYKDLQQQFFSRTIFKLYTALLDGHLQREGQGTISLPLRPDPLDRPRQVADHLHGKQAVTDYEVLGTDAEGRTLVALTPHTGRTHQLRVHCAHPEGLGLPIVGDNLYGRKAHRLCLHATQLAFRHPVTGESMHFQSTPAFV